VDAGAVRNVVEDLFHIPEGIADDQALERYGVDSIGLVRLVTALQRELGRRIPVDELQPDRFRSIASITQLAARLEARLPDERLDR